MRGRACAFGITTDAATPVVDPRNVVAAKAAIIEQIRMMAAPWRIVRMESIFDMRHFSQSTKRIDFWTTTPFFTGCSVRKAAQLLAGVGTSRRPTAAA
jgi:hypothetical protein